MFLKTDICAELVKTVIDVTKYDVSSLKKVLFVGYQSRNSRKSYQVTTKRFSSFKYIVCTFVVIIIKN